MKSPEGISATDLPDGPPSVTKPSFKASDSEVTKYLALFKYYHELSAQHADFKVIQAVHEEVQRSKFNLDLGDSQEIMRIKSEIEIMQEEIKGVRKEVDDILDLSRACNERFISNSSFYNVLADIPGEKLRLCLAMFWERLASLNYDLNDRMDARMDNLTMSLHSMSNHQRNRCFGDGSVDPYLPIGYYDTEGKYVLPDGKDWRLTSLKEIVDMSEEEMVVEMQHYELHGEDSKQKRLRLAKLIGVDNAILADVYKTK